MNSGLEKHMKEIRRGEFLRKLTEKSYSQSQAKKETKITRLCHYFEESVQILSEERYGGGPVITDVHPVDMVVSFILLFYLTAVHQKKCPRSYVRGIMKNAMLALVTRREWSSVYEDPYRAALVGDTPDRVRRMKDEVAVAVFSKDSKKYIEDILDAISCGVPKGLAPTSSMDGGKHGIIWRPMFLQDLERLWTTCKNTGKHGYLRLYPLLRCYFELAKDIPDILMLTRLGKECLKVTDTGVAYLTIPSNKGKQRMKYLFLRPHLKTLIELVRAYFEDQFFQPYYEHALFGFKTEGKTTSALSNSIIDPFQRLIVESGYPSACDNGGKNFFGLKSIQVGSLVQQTAQKVVIDGQEQDMVMPALLSPGLTCNDRIDAEIKSLVSKWQSKTADLPSFRMGDFAVEDLHDEMQLGSQQSA